VRPPVLELLKAQDALLRELIRVPRPDDNTTATGLTVAAVAVVEALEQHGLGKQLLDGSLLARMMGDSVNAEAHPERQLGGLSSRQASPW
jgi:hypothetical protein